MKKISLLDFGNVKDSELKSKLENFGYLVHSLSVPDLMSLDKTDLKGSDILICSYDKAEFNDLSASLVPLPNNVSIIFVVKNCSNDLFHNMRRFSNSLYVKIPFEKTELDFLISIASKCPPDNNNKNDHFEDGTELKNTEKTLKEIEERFQIMYENVPGGTMIIGRDYIIEDVNQRTCDITGYKKEELIGQLCDIVCPKGSLSKKCPIWVDGLEGFRGMDTAIKCKNGAKTPILKNTKRIFIDGNQFILENFQDISERKEAEEAVINSKVTAEEANRTKSEFLATMSHELRTPLNAIIGYSDFLLEGTFGELSEDQNKCLNHVSSSGKHLLKLINDILDISKVESGKMELHYEEFRVKDILGNVMNIVSPLARKKNIRIETSIDSENMLINADKIRLKQILFNLANNAVKFTPEGGHVLLEAHENEEMATFSVVDTGIGIQSENIDSLFLPFKQVDSTMSRKYDGTGLGLSLVKKFVEMHGGEIVVESQPGKGSKFTFNIPFDVVTH